MITTAGEQLLHDAKQIIALAEKAKSQVKRAEQGQVGELKIAYLSSACLSFMALTDAHKSIATQLHVKSTNHSATVNAFVALVIANQPSIAKSMA